MAREQHTLVRAGSKHRLYQIADARFQRVYDRRVRRLEEFRVGGLIQLGQLRAADARLTSVAGAEDQEVNQRIFVALSETSANLGILARDPVGPFALQCVRGFPAQTLRQDLTFGFEDRLRVLVRNENNAAGAGCLRYQRAGRRQQELLLAHYVADRL